ncbi:ABC transporter ATP-binding protein [Rhodococcus triatomae]|uniref:ABC-2 type transport system ATP-binding protein n=1 Tax=Rhodococcus triatomae TaxID=300028 RepID=A0A1G8E2Y2_9NOCA|nr:ABC transporter ATP-binding protein [Rhodococcus triatomae]QNG18290.1 ABC transporter ATP-binding protein [Rhodococcus triatomae]QNG22039.1 ABC transporter ATP-binding protein [Rhodococcus triatomae]SDH64332.1 ABC-2 type transport system ATP-binding protein [Rhodococcus triatomae]
MDLAISVRGLTKTFGDVSALNGLDLEVPVGRIHGFLGPNGSGKSTTIRILLGLIRADGGRASVLGADPWTQAVPLHRRLAYVPGDVTLWPNLTGGEAIDLLGRLRGGVDRRRRDELIERFDLDPTRRGRTYSRGNRQKVALIAALAADVDLLVLDEPTTGLDPLMEAVFRDCITEFASAGHTALLSSHVLAEVDALCESVTIIRAGRTIQSGTLADLRQFTRTTVTATTRIKPNPIAGAPGVHHLRVGATPNTVTFDVDSDQLDPVLTTLTGLGIVAVKAQPPTLEDLFLREYFDASGHGGPGSAK